MSMVEILSRHSSFLFRYFHLCTMLCCEKVVFVSQQHHCHSLPRCLRYMLLFVLVKVLWTVPPCCHVSFLLMSHYLAGLKPDIIGRKKNTLVIYYTSPLKNILRAYYSSCFIS